MIKIGIVGVGFMGYTHFEGAKKLKGGKVTAICTRDRKKLDGDWTGIQGNFGPPGGHVDLSGVARHTEYKEMLADPHIDLIDVCLPTDLHEQVTIDALQAGKHVLVEKPIAIETDAAERMVEAARNADRRLMVGQVLPFFPEFRYLLSHTKEHSFGDLRAAHFRRVICPPDWSDDISDFRRLGGWGIDLHIHDNHFIRCLCGQPNGVFSRGLLQDGFVNHVHTQYLFPDSELAVSSVSGGIASSGFQFGHAFEAYFDDATLMFDACTLAGEWTVNRPLTLIANDGTATQPDLSGDTEWCAAFTAELQSAVDAVESGMEPDVLSGRAALDALKMCHAEAHSIESGKAVSLA